MKALLVAAFALTMAVPAMAQTAAPAETKDGAAVAVTPKTTYEQAFTECAEATKDAAGEKAAAVKTCMLEKGFELKDEAAPAAESDKHSALDGARFAEAAVTSSTTAVTTTTDGGVAVTTPTTSVTTDAAGTTVTTTEGAVAAPAVGAAVTTETSVDGATTTTTTTHESH